jgi:hypothetical protein
MFIKVALAALTFSSLAVASLVTQPEDNYLSVAKSPDLEFTIDKRTMVVDVETTSFEFDLHTKFAHPIEYKGKGATEVVERTLVMCHEQAMVTLKQRVLDEDGGLIDQRDTSKIYPYAKPGFHRQLLQFFCAPAEKRKPDTTV